MESIDWFDWTLDAPAQNLACDEALLELAETAGSTRGWLRFWESPEHFVVLGYGNKVAAEVNVEACRELRIPILRRCSGGGTVLQGPGCWNYTLALPFDANGPLATIPGANCFIMEKQRQAFAELTAKRVSIEGHTDLAIDGRKFSGNAQRRARRHLLFHGTVLLQFDVNLMEHLLRLPPRQPDYRKGRGHSEFVEPLCAAPKDLRQAVARAWDARPSPPPAAMEIIDRLVATKYSRADWILKS